jgi:outer membrane receptor protein involved in Fe transport
MYQRAVRAPNISELFTPVTVGLTNLGTDPCAGAAPVANANLKAVCLAQGAPAFTIGAITNPTAGQANITTGGNINAKPETSDSYTIGGVIQPRFVPDLSISVDYYHIVINDALTVPTPGDLVGNCFNNITASSATDPNCTIIRRNPATGGLDGPPDTTGGLFGVITNQGRLLTDGIDVILNYRHDIGFAKLGLSFNGNYTFRSQFKSNAIDPNGLNRECVGYYSVNCSNVSGSPIPQYQWSQRTTLGFNWGDVSLLWRHISKLDQEPQDVIDSGAFYSGPVPSGTNQGGQGLVQGQFGDRNFGHIRPYDYFDLAGRFDVNEHLEITLTVANLFNVKPPIVGNTAGATSYNSGNTYPSTYDANGRRYGISAKVKF